MAEISTPNTPKGASLLALGFRPFFLGAGLSGLLVMGAWLTRLTGWISPDHYYGAIGWHAHEMLFGYTAAVIAGFLLTAIRNWTGLNTWTGPALGALAGVWLAARLAPFLPIPGILIALLDLAFFPLLALSLASPLWRGKNRVNRVFLMLLAGMFVAALLVHLQALGFTGATASRGNRLMLDLTLVTLLLVAGRIMPFFTERGIAGARPITRPAIETLTFVLAPLLAVTNLIWPWGSATGILALILTCVQLVRLAGWYDSRAWGIPILAVLYAGYLWLISGFALNGLASIGLLAPFPALHALSTGAIGVFTLGMMARVTLGHTGREMRSSGLTNLAFLLVNLAALTRVLPPLLWPEGYRIWMDSSGLLWCLAFGLFLWVHAPMLWSPRIDGRPG